jgi:hypothetical protein
MMKSAGNQVRFTVHGPFETTTRDIGAGRRPDDFWNETARAGLGRQTGCYVFALAGSKRNFVPYYVGLTESRFDREVFNPSNLRKYRRAIRESKKGRAALFLIVPASRKGKPSGKHFSEIEQFLIRAGAARNPEITNVKGQWRPKWTIQGVTGRSAGKPPRPARKLRKAMGLE